MPDLPFSTPLSQYASRTNRRNPISAGNITLLRNLNRDDLSGRELSQIIANDPAITARVLRVANSSYYGIPNRVSTINHATSLLGVDQVKILVQAFCFSEACGQNNPKEQVFEPRRFTAHSLIVSLLSGRLARHFGFQMLGKGEAEIGGLLHDIGKSVLAADTQISSREIRKTYRRYNQSTGGDESPVEELLQAERETLGFTHAELGAWLASDWNLPGEIQESIFFSHGPIDDCIHKEWPTVISLADHLANSFEMTCLPTTGSKPVHESIKEFLDSQGKLNLFSTLPDVLIKEIDALKDLYSLISEDATHVEESTTPVVEPKRVSVPPPSQPRLTQPPAWWEFFPGLTQIGRGRSLVGGTWIVVLLFLLLVLVGSVLSGMWGLAALSGMAVVLTWCVSTLMT